MTSQLPIIIIAGPTGVGKTACGIHLSKTFNGELIGADSIQIYRHFNIGASKPTLSELQGVHHHLIDEIEPDHEVDAAHYARLADAAIRDVHNRGRVPIVVGGTGLWLRALLRGLLVLPPVNPHVRKELENQWSQVGPEAMFQRLRAVDPTSAATIHPNDRLRVVRALEVHSQTGQALGDLRKTHALGKPRYRSLGICLDITKEHYRPVIERRISLMMQAGFVDEVRNIIARFGAGIRPLTSVGYRQVAKHLAQETPIAEAIAEMTQATVVYGRRQRTWFGSDTSIDMRVEPNIVLNDHLNNRIRKHLNGYP